MLIVEDDPAVREAFDLALAPLGVARTAVEDGRRAIDELHKKDVAVVVLDLMLPKISGLRVLEWMSGQAQDVPVVVVTGAVGARPIVARFPNLVRVVHDKPVALDLLRETVAQLLGIEWEEAGAPPRGVAGAQGHAR